MALTELAPDSMSVDDTLTRLDLLVDDGKLDLATGRQLLAAVRCDGRIVSDVLATRVHEEAPYHRRVFWERDGGWALVGLAWQNGSSTHIHDHHRQGLARMVEGEVQTTNFRLLDDDTIECVERFAFEPGVVYDIAPGSGFIHAVSALGNSTSVDLHLYFPTVEGLVPHRYDPVGDDQPLEDLMPGARFRVKCRPDSVQMMG